jgi:hypothetical protein
MAIDNVQAVLSKQIGTNKCDVISNNSNDRIKIITVFISQ